MCSQHHHLSFATECPMLFISVVIILCVHCRVYLVQELMTDPVFVASGHTFERAAIEEWFRDGNDINPLTGTVLSNLDIKLSHNWIHHLSSNISNFDRYLFDIIFHSFFYFLNIKHWTLHIEQTQLRTQGMLPWQKWVQSHIHTVTAINESISWISPFFLGFRFLCIFHLRSTNSKQKYVVHRCTNYM